MSKCLLIVAATALAASGCSTVSIEKPFGDPVAAEEAKKLEGVWLMPEEQYPLFVKHVKDNELRLAVVGWDESKFRVKEIDILLTVDEERQYVNLRDPESADKLYQSMRLMLSGEDHVVLYVPNAEAFAKAVDAGELFGTVNRGNLGMSVNLTATSEEQGEFIDPLKAAEQFEIDKPGVFRRLTPLEEGVWQTK